VAIVDKIDDAVAACEKYGGYLSAFTVQIRFDASQEFYCEDHSDSNDQAYSNARIMGTDFALLQTDEDGYQNASDLREDLGVPYAWSRGGLVEQDKTTWLRERGASEPQRTLLTVIYLQLLTTVQINWNSF
jgi:hypothetical protein